MVKNHKQNFLYEHFDEICKIFQKARRELLAGRRSAAPEVWRMRSDEAQFAELKTLAS
jgi:phosphomethylpyrimidine synthase